MAQNIEKESKESFELFIDSLYDNYKKLKWCKVSSNEINSEFNHYKIRIVVLKEGSYFLQVCPEGEYIGKTINSKDYKKVSELFDLIWEKICREERESFWSKINQDFNRFLNAQ